MTTRFGRVYRLGRQAAVFSILCKSVSSPPSASESKRTYLSLACGRDLRQVVFVFYLPVTSTACFRDFSLILNDSYFFASSSHKTRRNKNLNDPVQVL